MKRIYDAHCALCAGGTASWRWMEMEGIEIGGIKEARTV